MSLSRVASALRVSHILPMNELQFADEVLDQLQERNPRFDTRAYFFVLAALHSVMSRDAMGTLTVVFDRLYVLRNQLVHGGATWNGSVNRDQIRDCVAILADLVPVVIEVMMDNPGALWGEASYPVVEIV